MQHFMCLLKYRIAAAMGTYIYIHATHSLAPLQDLIPTLAS